MDLDICVYDFYVCYNFDRFGLKQKKMRAWYYFFVMSLMICYHFERFCLKTKKKCGHGKTVLHEFDELLPFLTFLLQKNKTVGMVGLFLS